MIPFILALYVTLICGLLLFRHLRNTDPPMGKRRLKLVILAYFISVFGWLTVIVYVLAPVFYVIINSLVVFTFMAAYVSFYHFVFEMTRISNEEKFPIAHYFFPASVAIAMFIWSFFVPFDVQMHLVRSHGEHVEEYKLYSIFFLFRPFLLLSYNIIYGILGFHRTMRYRKVLVNYSADEQRISLNWLYQFLFTTMGTLPMAAVIMFFTRNIASLPGLSLVLLLLPVFGYIILAHNVLLDNYVIIRPDSTERELLAQRAEEYTEPIARDDVRRLEAYMRKSKPYLNPKLKITDMTEELNTNRTSLSQLINRTYGMNFNRYVNRFRLYELEKLRANPRNAYMSELELVANAGFSDYRGYQRTQKREEV